MKSRVHSKVKVNKYTQKTRGIYLISNKKISYNLRVRIVNRAQYGRKIYGPIKITVLKKFRGYYSLSFILYRCLEDEMGLHNFGFNNVKFKIYKKRKLSK